MDENPKRAGDSRLGIASCLMAVMGVLVSGLLAWRRDELTCPAWAIHVIGLGLGVAAVRRKDEKRLYAILGIASNALILIAGIGGLVLVFLVFYLGLRNL